MAQLEGHVSRGSDRDYYFRRTGWASTQRTCNLVANLLLNDGQLTALKQ